jgi:hypothetical protein
MVSNSSSNDAFWHERFDQKRVGASIVGAYTRGGTVFTCGSGQVIGTRSRKITAERINCGFIQYVDVAFWIQLI